MINRFRSLVTFVILLMLINTASTQDVIMQGWYWDYPKTASGANWTDSLQTKVAELSNQGFTHLWLPPMSRASFGSSSNGYDPKDLFDLGEFGGGATGFGTRTQVNALINTIKANNMKAVADVVYNHRDGGKAENNPFVEGWIENYNCTKKDAGDNPFPSDRYRIILPLGGSTLNGAGTYYFKLASASKHNAFYGQGYKFYAQTNRVGFQGLPAISESEPNGGGDCGQGNNNATLGVDLNATIDNFGANCNSGTCGVDEFALTIGTNDFFAAGDTLFIYLTNTSGVYTDHFIYGLWSDARSMDIQGELKYQTYTDFTMMPSGRGAMNHTNFKPNGNPTNLNGDWDAMLFFYDYDQAVSSTRDTLISWSKWMMEDVQIDGFRMDAVKHFNPSFVSALYDSLNVAGNTPSLMVGEFFDFNAFTLKNWVEQVENNMNTTPKEVKVFDFALRSALKLASDQFGYDVRNIFNSGIVDGAGGNSNQAVTFVNNHDFRSGDEPVLNNPELAYAYILTNPRVGSPSVFYPDYYGIDLPAGPDPFLKDEIDNLLQIKNKYIQPGDQVNYITSFTSPTSITYNSGFANTSLIYQTANTAQVVETIVAINYAGEILDAKFKWPKMLPNSNLILVDQTGRSLTPKLIPTANDTIRLILPPQSFAVWVTDDVQSDCGFGPVVYVDKNAVGSNTGKSWSNAFTNLPSAIALTDVCSEIEEIWVKEGVYVPNVTNDRLTSFEISAKVKLIGGFPTTGEPMMMDRDWVIYKTTLSGNIGDPGSDLDNTFHVLTGGSFQDTAVVDGFYVSGGNADGTTGNDIGGGIYNLGKLSLKNILIEDNKSTQNGEAIFNSNCLLLDDVEVKNHIGSPVDVLNTGGGTLENKGTVSIKQ